MAVRFIPAIRAARLPVSSFIGAGIIPSLATLPYFWFMLPAYLPSYLPRVITGETGIFIVETILILLITRLPLRYCALLSLLANGASILAGLAVFS